MLLEIFKFELKYRTKRPETYLYFIFLFAVSLFAFDFIFHGREMGTLKANAPQVIGSIMAILSGFFMIITSMIMGVPILRDYEHQMESLLFVNPMPKRTYLLGRFMGSFVVLVLVFSAIIWGIIAGDFMPWRDPDHLQDFNFIYYLHPFITIVLPALFYGGSIFFVSGTLSRKMIVVYTQGLFFFLIFILSMAIKNPMISGILDPFSHTAIAQVVRAYDIVDMNTHLIPITGVLLYNRIFWVGFGILALVFGYRIFRFTVVSEKASKRQTVLEDKPVDLLQEDIAIPSVTLQSGLKASWIQLKTHSLFYFLAILKEPPFWAIIICGIVAILINSISLGATYGVNSYPTTYLIMAELKEMSIYFFLIILAAFTAEVIWKERSARLHLIYDALPVSDFINLSGKVIGVVLTYFILAACLVLFGVIFQVVKGYYDFNFDLYLIGFSELWIFLTLFTFASFFFQIISNSRFMGHILLIAFFIMGITLALKGYGHGLYKFGGSGLGKYSDMNGFGHFITPFLWFKSYWFAFSIGLLAVTAVLYPRGIETSLRQRWHARRYRITPSIRKVIVGALVFMFAIGGYIFCNTNVINSYYSHSEKVQFRVDYEKTLKHLEYIPQPKIVDVNLALDLHPYERNYKLEGTYILENKDSLPIDAIHIQTHLDSYEQMEYLSFDRPVEVNVAHEFFGYKIYQLAQALKSGDSIRMSFKQTSTTRGFTEDHGDTDIVYNGTFIDNDRFPSIGYNSQYELSFDGDRKDQGLEPRKGKADRNHPFERTYGKSGGDGSEINFEIEISTAPDQIAVAPGTLEKEWTENNRNYFHYNMDEPMINFYSIVSARYEVVKDKWVNPDSLPQEPIDLEIYYHPSHTYNLDRMMHALKASLT